MSKHECEDFPALDIYFLKKYGYLEEGSRDGVIVWTRGAIESERIRIEGYLYEDNPYLLLQYTVTNFRSEKKDFRYPVYLASTPCFFGGERFWLICPLIWPSGPCGRRVGVLYCASGYFGCRHCYDLAYRSQQETHTGWRGAFGKILFNPINGQIEALRVKYWRGKPTKRYLRLLRKLDQLPDIDFQTVKENMLTRYSQK